MPIMYADRVRVNVTSTGTGDAHLGSATLGFRTFADAVTAGSLADGVSVYYAIEDTGNSWETGIGTYIAGSPDVLARSVAATSSGDTSPLSLSGSAILYITLTAAAVETFLVYDIYN